MVRLGSSRMSNWYDDLIRKYPAATEKLRGGMLEFAAGWRDLIVPVLEAAEAEHTSLYCAKEKHGTLRIYFAETASDPLYKIAQHAEKMSARVCEECGRGGRLRGGGWMYVACDEHAGRLGTLPSPDVVPLTPEEHAELGGEA